MQMAQIPLIALGRMPVIRRNKILVRLHRVPRAWLTSAQGNVVFWIGLFAGFPLLCVGYCTY